MKLVVRHTLTTELHDLEPSDEPAVLALFEECVDWFEFATGQPAGPGDVQSLYYAVPAGADFSQKSLLVAETEGRISALVDLVQQYPTADEWTIGAFLVAPKFRRQRLGTALAQALGEEARAQGVRRIHATVTAGWDSGIRFLESLGFSIDPAAARPGGNRNLGHRERPVHRATRDLSSGPTGASG